MMSLYMLLRNHPFMNDDDVNLDLNKIKSLKLRNTP